MKEIEDFTINFDVSCHMGDLILNLSMIDGINFTIVPRGFPTKELKVCIDRKDCFDKIAKCPIIISLPETYEQYEFILRVVKDWLITDEGYKDSNEYNHDKWITEYPDEIIERA